MSPEAVSLLARIRAAGLLDNDDDDEAFSHFNFPILLCIISYIMAGLDAG